MNKWLGFGRLVADPIVKVKDENGKPTIVAARMAVRKDYKPKEGEPDSEFFDLVAFGPKAEYIATYGKSGSLIEVEGGLQNSSWEKEGVKHTRTEIRVSNSRFVGGSNKPQEAPKDNQADADEMPLSGY